MKKSILLFMLVLFIGQAYSQQGFQYQTINKKSVGPDRQQVDIGLGMGLEYGGFLGAQVEYLPISHLGIFTGGGYYLVGAGWELGAKAYIMPKITEKHFRVYLTGMYGTNAAIMVIGASEYNQIFKGASFGAGMEIRFGKKKTGGLNVALLYPVRASEYDNEVEVVKHDSRIENFSEPLPVNVSIGYHFEL